MKRIIAKPQHIGDTQTRYRVRLEDSVEVNEGSVEWIARQSAILDTILNTPEILYCGPSRWQKLSMFHDGTRWTVEVEAILDTGDQGAKELPASAGAGNPSQGT